MSKWWHEMTEEEQEQAIKSTQEDIVTYWDHAKKLGMTGDYYKRHLMNFMNGPYG